MKKSLISLAVGTVVGLTAATSAYAGPFMMDNGLDFGANGSTRTSSLAELAYNATLATSIYAGDPSAIGTAVTDTNQLSAFPFLGAAGNRTTIGGATVPFAIPFNPDQVNINSLTGALFPVDRNGFADGENDAYGFGRWGLTYQYTITGVTTGPGLVSTGVSFNDGYFDVFYEDGGIANGGTTNDGKQLLRLKVNGSTLNIANLDIFGSAIYDFDEAGATDDTAGDLFVQNFFRDVASGQTFYGAYIGSGPIAVSWSLDTNVQPPVPSANDLWDALDPTNSNPGIQGPLVRQSRLDGSIVFAVPEPGSLALLGLALAGLGLTQRRRTQTK